MIHWSPAWNSRCSPRSTQPIFKQLPLKVDPASGAHRAESKGGSGWLPDVLARGPSTRVSGTASGRRGRRTSSPWSARFPRPPPRPVARRCSAASTVLSSGPTSRGRASSAYVHRLPDAPGGAPGRRGPRDLPVPERGASARARGLRPRGVPSRLALAARWMWPSASSHSVGTPKVHEFRGSIPGPHVPLSTLRRRSHPRRRMTRGRCGSLDLQRFELASIAPRRFSRRTGSSCDGGGLGSGGRSGGGRAQARR